MLSLCRIRCATRSFQVGSASVWVVGLKPNTLVGLDSCQEAMDVFEKIHSNCGSLILPSQPEDLEKLLKYCQPEALQGSVWGADRLAMVKKGEHLGLLQMATLLGIPHFPARRRDSVRRERWGSALMRGGPFQGETFPVAYYLYSAGFWQDLRQKTLNELGTLWQTRFPETYATLISETAEFQVLKTLEILEAQGFLSGDQEKSVLCLTRISEFPEVCRYLSSSSHNFEEIPARLAALEAYRPSFNWPRIIFLAVLAPLIILNEVFWLIYEQSSSRREKGIALNDLRETQACDHFCKTEYQPQTRMVGTWPLRYPQDLERE